MFRCSGRRCLKPPATVHAAYSGTTAPHITFHTHTAAGRFAPRLRELIPANGRHLGEQLGDFFLFLVACWPPRPGASCTGGISLDTAAPTPYRPTSGACAHPDRYRTARSHNESTSTRSSSVPATPTTHQLAIYSRAPHTHIHT